MISSIFTTLAVLAVPAAAAVDGKCDFSFHDLNPQFNLHPSLTHDIALNVNQHGQITNPILLRDGSRARGCNSFGAQWLGRDNTFKKKFKGVNGKLEAFQNVFYVSGTQLKRRTLQQNWATLPQILDGRTVRMDLLCNNNISGCIEFQVAGNSEQEKSGVVSKFNPQDAGGVSGFIQAVYPTSNNPMLAKLEVNMDLSNLDVESIKAKYPKCSFDESALEFLWHLHVKWDNEKNSGFLGDCSPSKTGGHYDPTFACGGASQYKKYVTCTAKKDFPYECSPSSFRQRGYVCEVGDFSGKFGKLKLDKDKKIQEKYDDYFFAPKDLYNRAMYLQEQVQWNFMLHLACPQHKNPRIVCAVAELK